MAFLKETRLVSAAELWADILRKQEITSVAAKANLAELANSVTAEEYGQHFERMQARGMTTVYVPEVE